MNTQEQQYLDLLSKLLEADSKTDRTGTGTRSVFGHQMRFDLSQGFPLLTTKKVHFKSIVIELLWFLKGDTNIKYLLEHGCHIWTDWRLKEFNKHRDARMLIHFSQQEFEKLILTQESFAAQWGDIGKGYGHQWRNFGELKNNFNFLTPNTTLQKGFDQIEWVINEIKTNPNSRRLIVSGWNPHDVSQVDLPPCHTLFQFFVEPMTHDEMVTAYTKAGNAFSSDPYIEHEFIDVLCKSKNIPTSKLSCQLYQRSADTFLGVPFNIASYALLTHLIANECGLGVGEFIWSGGDVHLYSNHVDQAKEQISRTPYDFPQLKLDLKGKSIFDLNPEGIDVVNYTHHPKISAPVAV